MLLRLDLREALTALCGQAPGDPRALHFDSDLTQKQIAERLDIPLGTVKTRTLYALRALKLEIEERGLPD